MFNTDHIGQRDAVALFVRVGLNYAKGYYATIYRFRHVVLKLEQGLAGTHNVYGGPIYGSGVGVCDIIGGVKNVGMCLYCINADC